MRIFHLRGSLNSLLFKNNKLHFSSYVASVDQSTTSTKFSVFKEDGTLVQKQIVQHQQISLKNGWLQHNPQEIISNTHKAISTVIAKMKKIQGFQINHIQGLGICNQRQTVVCWDQQGNPLGNAIVWSDSRTLDICKKFEDEHGSFSHITGKPVSTYFSLFKILWMLENVPEVKQKYKNGKLKFGTIDSWLAYNLTGKFVTDASNAGRTYLCDITKGAWDSTLLGISKLNINSLPQIVDSFSSIGKIKTGELEGVQLCSILGDQQSSAFAHNLQINEMKITYGTGCFMLTNIGTKPKIDNSFVTTILNKNKGVITYGLQASVQCGGGTLNWAKRLGIFTSYQQLNNLPSVPQNLYFFPSFGSIFSPYWKTGVSGSIQGLNFNTTNEHILQALLEAITFRLNDNIKHEKFNDVKKIVVDGGMTANKNFMQLQADTFKGKKIEVKELDTCWGVAKGVLIAKGKKIQQIQSVSSTYEAGNNSEQVLKRYEKWYSERAKYYGWK